jgi:hypothetical protein
MDDVQDSKITDLLIVLWDLICFLKNVLPLALLTSYTYAFFGADTNETHDPLKTSSKEYGGPCEWILNSSDEKFLLSQNRRQPSVFPETIISLCRIKEVVFCGTTFLPNAGSRPCLGSKQTKHPLFEPVYRRLRLLSHFIQVISLLHGMEKPTDPVSN